MNFEDFIGQDKVKENLQLIISAAKLGRTFPHIGLYGPAGSGKTTLAEIICEELDAELVYINGSAVVSPVVFRQPIAQAVKLNGKEKRYIIVVDECHALPKKVQNNLLSVLESPAVLCTVVAKPIKLPSGKVLPKGDILKEKLPDNITFIFCTTDKAQLTDAMESRLHPLNLSEYTMDEKTIVVKNYTLSNNITLEESDYELIGNTAKNMRHLKKVCDRIVDFAVGQSLTVLTSAHVEYVLDVLGIDENGCDESDRQYLNYVREHGPVSLANIARYLNVAEKEVISKIEPFLIRREWVEITSKGRIITFVGSSEIYGEAHEDEVADIMEMLIE